MARGQVTWVNPPENKGKITRSDDVSKPQYEYSINAGDTLDGYIPKENDQVEFVVDPTSQRAKSVRRSYTLRIIQFELTPDGQNIVYNVEGAVRAVIDKLGEVQLPNGTVSVGRENPPFIMTITDALGNETSAIIQ